MNLKEDIDWKSLVFGSAICTTLATIGAKPGFDLLVPFAAIGLLYTGYGGKNLIWGTFLGAIAALPLFVVAMQGGLGTITPNGYSYETMVLLILLSCIVIGSIIGFVGALFHKNRDKAIAQREKEKKIGKNKTRERKNKE